MLDGEVTWTSPIPSTSPNGMPPTLGREDTDCLGEQIQRTFPDARVVKTLNTMNTALMTHPARCREHKVFVAGNDSEAKGQSSGCCKFGGRKRSLTSATSPPPAAPKCSCHSGSAPGRAGHRTSTSRSSARSSRPGRAGPARSSIRHGRESINLLTKGISP